MEELLLPPPPVVCVPPGWTALQRVNGTATVRLRFDLWVMLAASLLRAGRKRSLDEDGIEYDGEMEGDHGDSDMEYDGEPNESDDESEFEYDGE